MCRQLVSDLKNLHNELKRQRSGSGGTRSSSVDTRKSVPKSSHLDSRRSLDESCRADEVVKPSYPIVERAVSMPDHAKLVQMVITLTERVARLEQQQQQQQQQQSLPAARSSRSNSASVEASTRATPLMGALSGLSGRLPEGPRGSQTRGGRDAVRRLQELVEPSGRVSTSPLTASHHIHIPLSLQSTGPPPP
eukprot:NODE_1439_length_1162_cov_75.734052_g1182_i0.p1 GENE.NODE_1439_length_1162_cov_75.734052_g1182_i0~~NODE_1439_length_1162_cov_75.734052_g1182_i0.p1  ORF type:complete len:193 (+),score=34.75 NODE_1439_length_1162_cov_75.734052_g1182_i0:289-867(+)